MPIHYSTSLREKRLSSLDRLFMSVRPSHSDQIVIRLKLLSQAGFEPGTSDLYSPGNNWINKHLISQKSDSVI